MSAFPPGFALYHDDQRFEPTSVSDYTRKDGNPTKLVGWASDCASCSVRYTFITTLVVSKFMRRCSPCGVGKRRITNVERTNLLARKVVGKRQ